MGQNLAKFPLFAGLSKKQLDKVVTTPASVPEGTRLIHQGGSAFEFLIIEEGTADVLRDGEKIAALGPGDFVGEMGLLDKSWRRGATVVATSPLKLQVMTAGEFSDMMHALPTVAAYINDAVKKRLPD